MISPKQSTWMTELIAISSMSCGTSKMVMSLLFSLRRLGHQVSDFLGAQSG